MAVVLIPLPDRDFDVTEVAVPWRLLRDAGHDVGFATGHGEVAAADPLLLSGVIFGKLGAEPEPRRFYAEMVESPEFLRPRRYDALGLDDVDGLLLPGGHAPGMRQYLDHEGLQAFVASFFASGRPVGAICHGVLVAARARDPLTGTSPLANRRSTCLPKYLERTAYFATAWKLGRYYRTSPAYVEDEVRAAMSRPGEQFERGPIAGGKRGTATDDSPAFVVEDGNYVSARWPGDAYLFARRFIDRLG